MSCMIKTEFGIIEDFQPNQKYTVYEPEKYHCVAIDDGYIDDWWEQLLELRSYNMSLEQPQQGLSRWGITLIPPESLPVLQAIVAEDNRIHWDDNVAELATLIYQAAAEGKYMIHYGL